MATSKNRFKANAYWFFPVVVPITLLLIGWVSGGFAWVARSWVDGRIETKLDTRVDQRITTRLEKIDDRLASIDGRLSKIEGWKEGLASDVRILKQSQSSQEKRIAQAEAMNRVQDPVRILAVMRVEIEGAMGNPRLIPPQRVADYKAVLMSVPQDASGYWRTVNAVVNFESSTRQSYGLAPDPAKVARPCMTTGEGGNIFEGSGGVRIDDCVVDLETNIFINLTFVNCVVRYRGGILRLNHVRFVNCRFIIEATSPTVPAQKLLFAILSSADQSSIVVSTG
jgi:hypothetical protein